MDDLEDSADGLAMLLQLSGHEVRTAYNGEEALEVGEEFVPQVVLLDIGMPTLDGYEVCRRLKADPTDWYETNKLQPATVAASAPELHDEPVGPLQKRDQGTGAGLGDGIAIPHPRNPIVVLSGPRTSGLWNSGHHETREETCA